MKPNKIRISLGLIEFSEPRETIAVVNITGAQGHLALTRDMAVSIARIARNAHERNCRVLGENYEAYYDEKSKIGESPRAL